MPTRSAATLDVVVTTERLACSFCRGRKRKCNGKLEGCWRNFDWMPTNVSPRSRPASLHLRHLLPLPSTSLTPLDSLVMLMDQISIWDPLDTVPLKHTSWYLAKSAHRSTADDVVVKSYLLTTSGYDMEVIDRHTVLESLHDYPDILRLSICAFCSHFAKPSAPDMVTRSYYSSARELAHLCIDVPSLNYLKALLLLVFCGLALGDHGACIAFADMAFRMASLLKLDTPELLRLPSGNIPTPKEMAIRDRLWRVCVLYDNVLIATIRSGLLPRFFQYGGNDARPMLNPQYFTHISCDDESRTAFVHHLSTLSHALYKIRRTIAEIQEVKHADTSNVRRFWEALRTAQAMLEEWETTVPLSILHQKSEDITPFRFVGSNGYHFNGDTCYRVSLKLMYLAAQCHLGNAVRNCRESLLWGCSRNQGEMCGGLRTVLLGLLGVLRHGMDGWSFIRLWRLRCLRPDGG
ncbi:hypothetical protein BC829DRAFT_406731 [Chytridium lagenaria]|nr:hypothetical protein BC829DRAFT_406731 [Chytridium lagenaria]